MVSVPVILFFERIVVITIVNIWAPVIPDQRPWRYFADKPISLCRLVNISNTNKTYLCRHVDNSKMNETYPCYQNIAIPFVVNASWMYFESKPKVNAKSILHSRGSSSAILILDTCITNRFIKDICILILILDNCCPSVCLLLKTSPAYG